MRPVFVSLPLAHSARAGYTYTHCTHYHKKAYWLHGKIASKPVNEEGQISLSFPADHPVMVKTLKNVGGCSLVPDTQQCDEGYEAMIKYQKGRDCEFSVTVSALKKYSEAGKQEMKELNAEVEKLTCQLLALQEELESCEDHSEEIVTCIKELAGERTALQESMQQAKDAMTKLQSNLITEDDFLHTVVGIVKMLNLAENNTNIAKFVNHLTTQQDSINTENTIENENTNPILRCTHK